MIKKIDLCLLPLLPYALTVMLVQEIAARTWDVWWETWRIVRDG